MRYVRFVWRFTAGPAVVGMMTACSGAFSADLIDRADATAFGVDAAASDAEVDAADPGVTGKDASRPEVGGGQAEAGTDPPVPDAAAHDAAPAVDAAPPRGIVCGARSASALECHGTETCCATGKQNGYTYACITQGSTCGGLPIECAESADCTNNLACCYDATGSAPKVACVALSTCKMGQLLCNPALAAAACPTGYTCQPYGGSVPYYACK